MRFDAETDCFTVPIGHAQTADCAIITTLGNNAEDRAARASVRQLRKQGVNLLTMSPGRKNYSHHLSLTYKPPSVVVAYFIFLLITKSLTIPVRLLCVYLYICHRKD